MRARSRTDRVGNGSAVANGSVVHEAAGKFGPNAYADWRATSLGEITEALEQRLILRLAGNVKDRAVLDVGCGDGALTRLLWRSGAAQVTGCDIDPSMVARARAQAAKEMAAIAYAVADAGRLPFRDASFDLVTIVTVLAFVTNPEQTVAEIARVLRPEGVLILGDLGKWSPWAVSRRVRAWLGLGPMWRAARFRTAGELRALVEAAPLSVEDIAGAVYYPRSRLLARLIAPIDPWLGDRTTLGAAFLAVRAVKRNRRPGAGEINQGGASIAVANPSGHPEADGPANHCFPQEPYQGGCQRELRG